MVPVDTTLNTYIRNYANLKGTKYMCLEGGCGICVVSVKRQNAFTKATQTYAVNSVSRLPSFSQEKQYSTSRSKNNPSDFIDMASQ
jgi:xanthine dehydrogenase iron-sulfur cluster and FAD-binding subunit A